MRERRPWLGTSWKMNKTRADTVSYLSELGAWAAVADLAATVTVFPPFTALPAADAELSRVRGTVGHGRPRPLLQLGAQNMHWLPDGAQTGEISAAMLADCGVNVVELGHFERRTQFCETDEAVNLKVAAATVAGLSVVVCVGDSAADRRFGVADEAVRRQVKIALHGLPSGALASVVIAYEPGWAIGVGGTRAEPADVAEMITTIRAAVAQACGGDGAKLIRVVYGGSVDATTADRYAAETAVDGLFVGRAALNASDFIAVIERFCAVQNPAPEELLQSEGNR